MNAIIWAATALAITAILAWSGLRAWRGWLDLKRHEIAQAREAMQEAPEADSGTRIEIAAIRERLRKLEALAAGLDL